jgi:TolA-binding protein
MERERDSILEHMPLEEIRIEEIEFLEPPREWDEAADEEGPELPPVLAENVRGFSLLGNHRTLWRAIDSGKNAIKAFVVRSAVHVEIAHKSVSNCAEEALLFQGLLHSGIVSNRSRLAELLGFSRARITQVLNLLKLPGEIQRKILLTDSISEFQLRPLIRIDDPVRQKVMFDRLLSQKLTGRQMALVATSCEGEMLPGKVPAVPKNEDASRDGNTQHVLKEVSWDEETSTEKTAAAAPGTHSDQPEKTGFPGLPDIPEDSNTILSKLGTLRQRDWEKTALDLGVTDREMLFLRGISFLRSGLYREAIERLEEVLDSTPEHALAHFYLGRCHNLLGDLIAAEVSLRNAVELRPENPEYLTELAIVLEKLDRNSEASTCYRKAGSIRKTPRVPREGQ